MINISKYKRPVSVIFSCVAIVLVSMFIMGPGYAEDIFLNQKDEIKDTVGAESTVQFALLGASIFIAALMGYRTKDWGTAIGTFVVGMLFLNITMKVVGLA
ncbi:hypothetical protein [uncultured Shewanella sp.]|uniref:hypothetical protein n=1 Tax=uncultured Shewanella sp. TaxID=173975 RepID=UPI00262A30A8|nr:hypothetical protein [uncultured Shewanella sp.]